MAPYLPKISYISSAVILYGRLRTYRTRLISGGRRRFARFCIAMVPREDPTAEQRKGNLSEIIPRNDEFSCHRDPRVLIVIDRPKHATINLRGTSYLLQWQAVGDRDYLKLSSIIENFWLWERTKWGLFFLNVIAPWVQRTPDWPRA